LCSLLRDGLQIPQNREVLTLGNMNLVKTGEILAVPVVVKTRWLGRVDMEVILRRRIARTWSVLNILSAQGAIVTDDGIRRTIKVP
jgi:hypothetical protein